MHIPQEHRLIIMRTLRGAHDASENDSTTTSICDPTKGRNGRDGRDGMPVASGPPGRDGKDGERGEPGPPGPRTGGVSYTRWGKTTCPDVPGSQLVYAGRTGRNWWNSVGRGSNYLCMPENPEYGRYTPGVRGWSLVYGTEYEPEGYTTNGGPFALLNQQNHNVPCVVCDASTRERVLMIPLTCPDT